MTGVGDLSFQSRGDRIERGDALAQPDQGMVSRSAPGG
jgi:hypothetical protein